MHVVKRSNPGRNPPASPIARKRSASVRESACGENQVQAQSNWRVHNPDYWRRYRETHPDYAATNRKRQDQRNSRRKAVIAKSDASTADLPKTGLFRLMAIDPASLAGSHEWVVQLTFMS